MKKIIIGLLLLTFTNAFGRNIHKAFEALSIFDYFKAKHLFYKSINKNTCAASFGLATIYNRTDNPFSNIDSAAKYIAIAQTHFVDTITYNQFTINKTSINQLSQSICDKGFLKYSALKTHHNYTAFLNQYYFASDSLKNRVYDLRDQQQFNYYDVFESSDSIQKFIKKYPESNLYQKAETQYFTYQFTEQVNINDAASLKRFLHNYSNNPLKTKAEIALFNVTKDLHDADSLYNYINTYSTALTKQDAWKLLYSLFVTDYTKKNLTAFLNKYPNYPDKGFILNEIELSEKILIPFETHTGLKGYIDTLGHYIIKPKYGHITNFKEGFAIACIGDSCFYINKHGEKMFDLTFEEGEAFNDGIATIKQDSLYYLINRSGQIVSSGYADIGSKSNGLYVCKKNNYSGAINAKGEVIIPFVYQKLGDFKNGYAYYYNNHYGLVTTLNQKLKAQWDWISGVDTNLLVVISKNGKFGLMNLNEDLLLNTEYDKITHCKNSIYLIVKNNYYSFYNSKEQCLLTSFENEYKPSDINDFTNGTYFKLEEENDVGLQNKNGKIVLNFETYDEIAFCSNGFIRVSKNNKYGYLDANLKSIIPLEFNNGNDFENGAVVLQKKETAFLINEKNKTIFSLKDGDIHSTLKLFSIKSNVLLIVVNNLQGIISLKGEILLPANYDKISPLTACLFRCEKLNETFLFNTNTKQLTKIN